MEQTTTVTTENGKPARPTFLTVLCVLSYIGSGLWTLVSLIGIFAGSWIMSLFMGGAMNKAMDSVDTSGMTPEQVDAMKATAEAAAAGGGMLGMISSYLVVIFIISLVLAGLSLFGIIKMWNLKKSGFWMYSIVNGLLAILGLIGGGIFGALVGIAFIVMYGLNLKHMK